MAIQAVKRICDFKTDTNVDLRDIRIVKKLGGTLDDTQLVEGLVFADKKPATSAGGPTKMQNAKVALLQFPIASPKTDVENNIAVSDYS